MNMNMNQNKECHGSHKHSPMKHMLHMILCCGIPVLIIFALPFIAGISPAAAGILGFIAPFICPVMMGGMLLMMFRKEKPSCCDEKSSTKEEITQENQ